MMIVGLPPHASKLSSRSAIVLIATICLLSFTLISYFSTSFNPRQFYKTPHTDPAVPVPSKGSTREFLPLEVARETCSNRRLDIYTSRDKSRKVYDLFLINTELDWLEIRLGELHEEVDYFVILEASTTFQGEEKPLYLQENWARFQSFHHRIIYRELNLTGVEFKDTWERERYQREALYNQIIPYLEGEQKVEPNDVLIVSDLDEIPQPNAIVTLRNCAIPARITLHSELYYYSFQWRRRSGGWGRLKATYYAGNDTVLPEDLRSNPSDVDLMHMSWHCSTCFPTLRDMVNKMQSFSHAEFNQPEFTNRAKILKRVRSGCDLFDRTTLIYDRIDNNRNVPSYILKPENQERFAYLTDRDPPSGNFQDFCEEDLVMPGNVSWTPPLPDLPPPA